MSLDVYITHNCKYPHNVFQWNITHNLGEMAREAGIYYHLWRPEEIGITKAEQLIEPLESALEDMKNSPSRFRAFNPPNGWGSYEDLLIFVRKYLEECKKYPDCDISASR